MVDPPAETDHDARDPQPLDRFEVAAIAALTLTAIASVVSIAFDIHRLSVVNHLVADAASLNVARFGSDLAAAHSSDHQTAVIGVVELVVFVICSVCFIAWFHRAYRNLARLGAASTRYGTGWAIGGWFVPILNAWRPKQIANDIWRGSDPGHPHESPSWKEPVTPLLWFWWAAWLVASLLTRVSAQDWNKASSAHALRTATGLDIAAESMSVVAASLAIAVICALTRREGKRARARRESVSVLGTGAH
jgi:hypothetical protein